MAIPGENYVLRLLEAENQPPLVHMNVLDVARAETLDTFALVEWAYGTITGTITYAGFSVLRIDKDGNLMWQVSRALCSFNNIECGQFEIQGHLAVTPNGVIVAGSGIKLYDTARKPIMFAMRIDNAGVPRWARTYAQPPIPDFGRIVSIAPMQIADHYLIAANTFDADAWFFEIDGNGAVMNAGIEAFVTVRRLRATPTQGICAVGTISEGGGATHAAVLNFDAASFKPRWMRSYFYGVEAFLRGVHWFDIAEGNQSLLVVGNLITNTREDSPMMAFLETDAAGPKVGDVRSASIPRMGTDPVRLRGITTFFEEVIPLAPLERRVRFAVTGDVKQQPWQFVIGENGVVEWQKRYRLNDGDTGRLAPAVWPSFERIVAGGSVTTGSRPRGFLASSRLTNLTGTMFCSEEVKVEFPKQELYQFHPLPGLEALTIEARECFLEEGPALRVKKECLRSQ